MANTMFREIQGTASQIIDEVKRLIREGSARRLLVKNKKGKVLLDVPLNAGVVGTAFFAGYAPILSGIGMYLLFSNDVHVMVERHPNGVQNLRKDDYDVSDESEYIDIEDEEEGSGNGGNNRGNN